MSKKPIFVGADVGSSRTKVAVMDSGKQLLGYAIKKSGIDFTATVQECLQRSL
ncbi:MAG: ATPase, partial [Deltaproteobacteria bacterium]|nr:ATPase [Deltaproteobacteria bacterium]